ncbi:MAG: hypothetical protein V7K43_00535, partial [Nostoc sp.]
RFNFLKALWSLSLGVFHLDSGSSIFRCVCPASFAEDDADKALDIKIDGFIKKPIDPNIVTAKFQAILAQNSENFPNNKNFI